MDFNYSEEDEKFRHEFRSWLEKNPPKIKKSSLSGTLGYEEDFEDQRVWHKQLHSGGWVAPHWPKEYGGRGATLMQSVVYNEELERAGTSAPAIGSGISLLGPTLMHWGTEEQKKRYIPRILSGEDVWCQGYSEPNSGSDLASLQTRAVEEGDYFVVNGSKIWTSNAHHADMIFLLTRTDPEAPKHKGITYLLVDMKTPGITVRPLVQITGAHGFNQTFFDNVRVPKENLVGEKNNGWQVAITTLMFERTGAGGRGGLATITPLVDLAKRLKRNGKTAWDDPGVRQKIADFACEAEAIKYTGLRQLTRQLKGLPPGPEGSMLKLVGSELNLRVQMYAMELLGPYGQLEYGSPQSVDEGSWSYRMLAARALCIAGGSNQIQHNIIGERVLGLPKGY